VTKEVPAGDSPVRLSVLDDWIFEASEKASTQGRALAIAGIAAVWLFAGPFFLNKQDEEPSALLVWAGASFALVLAVDAMQLIARTALLERAYQRANRHSDPKDKDPVVTDTGSLNPSTATFFYAKFLPLFAGYVLLIVFFLRLL
jgi:hypothetical protein